MAVILRSLLKLCDLCPITPLSNKVEMLIKPTSKRLTIFNHHTLVHSNILLHSALLPCSLSCTGGHIVVFIFAELASECYTHYHI